MQKKRILVIDDEPAFTSLLKSHLEESGAYEVREVHRGEQALDAASVFKPDLILLDVIMPTIDGAQVAVQFKADETFRETPLVFLTAVVSKEEVKERTGRIGGHPFIAKPATPEEVMAVIAQYL